MNDTTNKVLVAVTSLLTIRTFNLNMISKASLQALEKLLSKSMLIRNDFKTFFFVFDKFE